MIAINHLGMFIVCLVHPCCTTGAIALHTEKYESDQINLLGHLLPPQFTEREYHSGSSDRKVWDGKTGEWLSSTGWVMFVSYYWCASCIRFRLLLWKFEPLEHPLPLAAFFTPQGFIQLLLLFCTTIYNRYYCTCVTVRTRS